jgi:hypothetical protein
MDVLVPYVIEPESGNIGLTPLCRTALIISKLTLTEGPDVETFIKKKHVY